MTTTKYDFVRRAMYEKAPFQKLKQPRSIKDSLRIFKPFALILFLLAFIASLSGLVLVVGNHHLAFALVLSAFATIILFILEKKKEAFLYEPTRRSKELFARLDDYNECLAIIGQVFNYYEIDSYEKAERLKDECEAKISRIKRPFAWLQKVIYSGLIAIPLSAYIGYKVFEKDIVTEEKVISLLLTGLSLLIFTSFAKWLFLITEGYYKDQCLLQAINEYEYTNKLKREK